MTVAHSTPAEGMATLAEAAVRSGKTHLVGVGGDGTHHDILNGIVRAGGLKAVTYAPLPLGTGNDWVRTLRTPRGPTAWLEMLLRRNLMHHRIGRLACTPLVAAATASAPGAPAVSCFLNVAGMAYDAEVVRRSEKARWKHRLLYPLLTLLYLKDFEPPTVTISYDGNTVTCPVHTVNFGIGRYNGGGMRLVPQADPTAETLALTFARRLPVWKILLSSWRFYTPTIGELAEVTTTHAREISITPVAGTTLLEADGELLGGAPVTATLLGESLRVVVP